MDAKTSSNTGNSTRPRIFIIDWQLQIEQNVSLLETITGWDTNNKYVIKNGNGEQMYYAFEKTGTCMRTCCGSRRSFTIHIVDNINQVNIKLFSTLLLDLY